MLGYRVGEPQETNAKKLIEFEVLESGNVPMLDDLAKALKCNPTLESIKTAIDRQFGDNAIGMWLCDSPEWAVKRYGPGEAYSMTVPSDAIVGTDLGADGKLWIWRKQTNPDISETFEGEIIKQRGDWILTRENLEPRKYKKPNYFYRVYYKEEGKWVLAEQGGYTRCLDAFTYQSELEASNPTVYVEIRMLKDAPPITGTDMKTYGAFRKGRVYAIPKGNARVFIKHGIAVATRKEAEKPTLKAMFRGEVLTPYIEAALVKPLVETDEEKVISQIVENCNYWNSNICKRVTLEKYCIEKKGVENPGAILNDLERRGIAYTPKKGYIGLTEPEKYDLPPIERADEEERRRKARQRAEALIKEIREARGE